MRRILRGTGLLVVLLLSAVVSPPGSAAVEAAPEVDIALCLDTSGTMEGLLDAARAGLWELVSDLAFADPVPRVRVALLTYGNDGNPAGAGWVRVETPLTGDLDLVSRRLFELETGGGHEYVARAVRTALRGLEWSERENALRLIVVAGNEAVGQDPLISLTEVVTEASGLEIDVHPVFCDLGESLHAPGWGTFARMLDRELTVVDRPGASFTPPTPLDQELATLSSELNETYLPLGETGREAAKTQALLDERLAGLSPAAAASRAGVKATPLFSPAWDLLEAIETRGLSLDDMAEEDLPIPMRGMTSAEREIHVEEAKARRETIRRRIRELSASRAGLLARQVEDGAEDRPSLSGSIRATLRAEAERRGISIGPR